MRAYTNWEKLYWFVNITQIKMNLLLKLSLDFLVKINQCVTFIFVKAKTIYTYREVIYILPMKVCERSSS